MLERHPERHVRLMPARYVLHNELGEGGRIADLSAKFNKQSSC